MNPSDHKRIALKSLQTSHLEDKNEISNLRHEYTVGSTLEHPAVNTVHEFNVARGVPYVVMDLFAAPNLKQSMRQSPELVSKYRCEIIEQAVAGLGHLHEAGWVHRDVKPDNFLLNEAGELKLIDFAIAQKMKKKGFGKLFTAKMAVQGTRSYMSPEQIRGEPVDGRADIYSLGCMIFELFSGRVPFTGNNPDELLTKHLRAPVPSLAAHCQDVTTNFSKLVSRMMAKKPEARPQSMHELQAELENTRILKQSARSPDGTA